MYYLDNQIIPPEKGIKLESTDFEYLFHSRLTLEEILFLKNKEVVDNSSFAILLVDAEKNSVGNRTLNYLKEKKYWIYKYQIKNAIKIAFFVKVW